MILLWTTSCWCCWCKGDDTKNDDDTTTADGSIRMIFGRIFDDGSTDESRTSDESGRNKSHTTPSGIVPVVVVLVEDET